MSGLIRRFVDLSVPIENVPSELLAPSVEHEGHAQGADVMQAVFGCSRADLPGGLGWANDQVTLSTHTGTHLDAPWHFAPTTEKGRPARTIDDVPLEWCYGPGLVLDMTHKVAGSRIEVADVDAALDRIGVTVRPGDIVLVRTGADKLWGTAEYLAAGCGMGREATLSLIDRGVRVMGTDAWGFDRPFFAIREEFERTHEPGILWEAHFAGIEKEYCHIEKLANLDLLPPAGFTVICFPVKVAGGSAGWVRAVALLEEERR